MDLNKAKKLNEIYYCRAKTCGECEHSNISDNSMFGVCKIHKYFHLKHQEERELSIYRYGYCDSDFKYKERELKFFNSY